jgi:hypothetical protein
VIQWRIYYDDGTTRDSNLGVPATADEKLGVLVIAQYRSDGVVHTIYGAEYYLFDGSYWVPIGLNGLEDWTMNKLQDIRCITKGRAIANGLFNEIFKRAQESKRKGTLD